MLKRCTDFKSHSTNQKLILSVMFNLHPYFKSKTVLSNGLKVLTNGHKQKENPYEQLLFLLKAVLTLFLLILLVLSSCTNDFKNSNNSTTVKNNQFDTPFKQLKNRDSLEHYDAETRLYSNYLYGFAIKFPYAWESDRGNSKHTIRRWIQPDSAYSFAINLIPIQTNESFSGMWAYYERNKVKIYEDLKRAHSSIHNTDLIDYEATKNTFSNHECVVINFAFWIDHFGEKYQMSSTFYQMVRENQIITLGFTSPKSFLEAEEHRITKIFDSFYFSLQPKSTINNEAKSEVTSNDDELENNLKGNIKAIPTQSAANWTDQNEKDFLGSCLSDGKKIEQVVGEKGLEYFCLCALNEIKMIYKSPEEMEKSDVSIQKVSEVSRSVFDLIQNYPVYSNDDRLRNNPSYFIMSAPKFTKTGENIRVNFYLFNELADDHNSFNWSPPAGFTLIEKGFSRSQSFIVVTENKMHRLLQQSIEFIIRPQKSGSFLLSPGKVTFEGNPVESNSIKIEVSE